MGDFLKGGAGGYLCGEVKLQFQFNHCCNCAFFDLTYEVEYGNGSKENKYYGPFDVSNPTLESCDDTQIDPKEPRIIYLGNKCWKSITFRFRCLSGGRCASPWVPPPPEGCQTCAEAFGPIGCHEGAECNVFLNDNLVTTFYLQTSTPQIVDFCEIINN